MDGTTIDIDQAKATIRGLEVSDEPHDGDAAYSLLEAWAAADGIELETDTRIDGFTYQELAEACLRRVLEERAR